MNIGKTLKRLRKQKDLTQVQLSRLSGVQLATLNRIEHNKAKGTVETYCKLSHSLNLKLSEFFREVELESVS